MQRFCFVIALSALLCGGWATVAWANGIVVTDVVRQASPNRDLISFRIGWQNSWNVLGPPANHDAAWVFIKFRPCSTGAQWNHALLELTTTTPPYTAPGHTLGGGLVFATPVSLNDRFGTPGGHNTGAMLRRSSIGTGHITDAPCTLRVVGGVTGGAAAFSAAVEYDIRVVGIEMVQVRQGAFQAGDSVSTYCFQNSLVTGCLNTSLNYCWDLSTFMTVPQPCTNCECETNCWNYVSFPGATSSSSWVPDPQPAPLAVNTENATLNTFYNGVGTAGPTLPANYPKGVQEFYVMKYEISQGQYTDFLNTLNLSAAPTGTVTCSLSGPPWSQTGCVGCGANCVYCYDASFQQVDPITCQLMVPPNPRYPNNNGWSRHTISYNATTSKYEAGEPNRAGNFLSYTDVLAYLDWAALRPLTELEYEKATRGNQPVISGQWAWGSDAPATLLNLTAINGPENGTETVNTPTNSNIRINYIGLTGVAAGQGFGPVGCGLFARNATPTRTTTGAAYWGAMEMSGNAAEVVISAGATTYTGLWGNGVLSVANTANTTAWPDGTNSQHFGWRGGSWSENADRARISDRQNIYWNGYGNTDREDFFGGRGAR
jgi:formylglycine-generating enzyme required for sulfatase activity